jgi:hypothetical protein
MLYAFSHLAAWKLRQEHFVIDGETGVLGPEWLHNAQT